MAVDVAIDKTVGPILLEINARAGLGVQVANLAPLRRRLERIEGIKVTTPTKGVRVAKDLFGNIIEKEITHVTGKQVIGIQETISIILKDQTRKVRSSTNTGQLRTTIDKEFATEIGLLTDNDNYDPEKETLKIKLSVAGTRLQTVVDVKKFQFQEDNKNIKVILGSRDLRNFIIDPNKTITKAALPGVKDDGEPKLTAANYFSELKQQPKINFAEVDKKLIAIDSQIKLISHLKPTNLEEEKEKFLDNPKYNPQFQYKPLKFEPYELYRSLDRIETDDSPLGQLFRNKKFEIEKKIALLEQRGNPMFTEISIDLFGNPTYEEFNHAKTELLKISHDLSYQQNPLEETINAEEAQHLFNQAFQEYGLENWKAKIKESMVADCLAGKNNAMFIRQGAQFSKNRIKNLIIHEIETHILTAENGKRQPYQLFQRGLGFYLTTQEGLAVYNTDKYGEDQKIGYKRSLLTLLTVGSTLTKSFAEVAALAKEYNVSDERAFSLALKVKRGLEDTSQRGGFTKGYVYWNGKKQVEEYINSGQPLTDLYYGKYDIADLPLIRKTPNLVAPKYLPKWLKK